MKKRGGSERRLSHKPAKKARTKPARSSSPKNISPKKIPIRRSSESLLKREEELVGKEFRWAFGPREFHVTLLVLSLVILSFLLNSWSLVFYGALTIGVLLFAHFLHFHSHRPHDVISIIGIFFFPLLFTIIAFPSDPMVWFLLAVYILSAISTIIIYHHHKGEHAPLKIMWQVTYSKIVAITAAMIVACLLPFIFPDTFLSVFELIFIFLLPTAFVFFFFSKFFYVYFFDRRHIRIDILRSLRHTIIYSLVFMVVLMCIYSLFATALYNSRMDKYDSDLDLALLSVSNVEKSIMRDPQGFQDLKVTKDLMAFSSDLRDEISKGKADAMERRIAFADIMDDSYFRSMADNVLSIVKYNMLQQELVNLKAQMFTRYGQVSEAVGQNIPQDGGSQALDAYIGSNRLYVEKYFNPLSLNPEIQDSLEKLNDPLISYSDFENDGFLYWFTEDTGLFRFYDADSLFGRQMGTVIKHLEEIRQFTRLYINLLMFIDVETVSSSAMEHLYFTGESDSMPVSAAVRYSVLKDWIDHTQGPQPYPEEAAGAV